jgi:nitroreductase
MDFMQAIYSRRAVREFTAESVDEKTLRQLIDAATRVVPSFLTAHP